MDEIDLIQQSADKNLVALLGGSDALENAYSKAKDTWSANNQAQADLDALYQGLTDPSTPLPEENANSISVQFISLDAQQEKIKQPYVIFFYIDPLLPRNGSNVDHYGPVQTTAFAVTICPGRGRNAFGGTSLGVTGASNYSATVWVGGSCARRPSSGSGRGKFSGTVRGLTPKNYYTLSGSFGYFS